MGAADEHGRKVVEAPVRELEALELHAVDVPHRHMARKMAKT